MPSNLIYRRLAPVAEEYERWTHFGDGHMEREFHGKTLAVRRESGVYRIAVDGVASLRPFPSKQKAVSAVESCVSRGRDISCIKAYRR